MQYIRKSYRDCWNRVNLDRLMRRTSLLFNAERGQTFPCYHRAADLIVSFLEEDGIPNIERLEFPADGKTSFQDKRMPLAWDASVGRLTLLNPGENSSQNSLFAPAADFSNVVADYDCHPFHLVKGSVAAPPGGVKAKILTEAQFLAGDDSCGGLVLLEPETWPRRNMLTPILDRGGLGFITDFLIDRYETPDAVQWVQACSETRSWHVDSETRPFIGFSVSPRTGDRLRKLAAESDLFALVESDGRRYKGTFPCVTALIPGKKEEEFWLLAHTCEPLATDDANGVAAALETAQILREGKIPEFSIRVLFSLELYGFAAYAALRGGCLAGKVIGACNFDSTPATKDAYIRIEMGGPATPFRGSLIAELMADSLSGLSGMPEICLPASQEYFDDLALADPTIGVPMVWPLNGFRGARYWHNSAQNLDHIDPETFRSGTAFSAAFSALAVHSNRDLALAAFQRVKTKMMSLSFDEMTPEHFLYLAELERKRLETFCDDLEPKEFKEQVDEFCHTVKTLSGACLKRESKPLSKWRKYAEGVVPHRKTIGFTQDLVRIPKEERFDVPDDMIYGPLSNLAANIDGKKDLEELIRETEYERGFVLPEKTVQKYISTICRLADYGYFDVVNRNEIQKKDILDALNRVGVRPGDFLMVHSSLSAFGHIEGGPETVIEALRSAVGSNGTVLFPAFTRNYRVLGGVNRQWSYRPYDKNDLSSLKWIGNLPIWFLRRNPDAPRSRHYTHSWTGFGKEAKEALRNHRPDDSPASIDSPMGEALRRKGKILHFGSGLNSTTFLHYLEDQLELPGLGPALVAVRESDGSTRDLLIQKHLPGDREFYRLGEKSRFFQTALNEGLVLNRSFLGPGELILIDIPQLWAIGKRLCLKDPGIIIG